MQFEDLNFKPNNNLASFVRVVTHRYTVKYFIN